MIPRIALLFLVAVACGGWGFAIGAYQVFPWAEIRPFKEEIEAFVRGNPNEPKSSLLAKTITHPQKNTVERFEGQNGFEIFDPDFRDEGYLLLPRFSDRDGQSIVELVRLSDRRVLHKWRPDIGAIAERSTAGERTYLTKARYRIGHPLLLEDGGLVFHNFEGPLVRIDACSRIQWVIDEHFHHSIEYGPDGTLWVAIVIEPSSFPTKHRDDAIANVSTDGKVLSRVSVSKILEASGERGLLYGVGAEEDPIHLNDIQPAFAGDGIARTGDLMLSMRHRSAVALFKPDTGRLVWWKVGPWLNQHDANFLGDGRISVFGNDVIRYDPDKGKNERGMMLDPTSQVYVFYPASGEIETPYREIFRRFQVTSRSEGRSRILRNGDVFVEEQNHSRLLRLSPEKARWTYVNRMEDGQLGELHWTRYLYRHEVRNALRSLGTSACGGTWK